MFCDQCGAKVALGAKFCEECGAPLAKAGAKPLPAPATGVKRRGWLWLLAGGGVILLLAGGLAFAFLSWFDPEKRASQLFADASQLVQSAQEAEQTS